MRLSWSLAVLGLMAMPLAGATLQMQVGPERHCPRGELRVLCESGDGCSGAAERVVPIAAGSDLVLDLDRTQAWRLTASASGCWAAPLELPAGDWRALAEIVLLPAATIRGQLPGPDRPQSIEGHVSVPPHIVNASTSCRVDAARWSCTIPSASADVRLTADGFAPQYYWGLSVPAGETRDLGEARFARGGSIAGWVAAGARGATPEGAVVELYPETALGTVITDQHLGVRTASTHSNRRGFFQFRGVAPGSYAIVARKEGLSVVRVGGIPVSEPCEYLLKSSIVLPPLAALDVSIDPPLDGEGKPWRVRLTRPQPLSNFVETIAQESATPAGTWRRGGLDEGKYFLSVMDGRGSLQERRAIEVGSASGPVQIQLAQVPIRGRLTAGDRPLAATLWFQHPDGSRRVRLAADSEGRFEGVLPEEGKWRVQVQAPSGRATIRRRSVEVHRPPGAAAAEVNVTLPGGRLAGRVVDDSGRPLVADVAVSRDGALVGDGSTAEDGTFEIIGLEPGDVSVEAEADDAASGAVPARIGEEGDAQLQLVARRRLHVKGWIVTPAGQPVAGAMMRYFAAGSLARGEAVSGPSGEFVLDLPAAAPFADVIVLAPGLPIVMRSIAVNPEAARTPMEIMIDERGSRLTINMAGAPPWPYIRSQGSLVSLLSLLLPSDGNGPPRGLARGGFSAEFAPGQYTVCPGPQQSDRCITQTLSASSEVTFDATPFFAEDPHAK